MKFSISQTHCNILVMASNMNFSFFMLLFVFAILSYQTTFLSYAEDSMSIQYEAWMTKHNRTYNNNEEKEKRFQIFKDNVNYIESFNRDANQSYELEINKFADLTKEEFLNKYAGSNYRPSIDESNSTPSPFRYGDVKAVPPSLDWRLKGAVTYVRNQGQCGACWAFATLAAIEGIVEIMSGDITALSEQQIIDCSLGGYDSCRGAKPEDSYNYVQGTGALASERDYPYQMRKGTCRSGLQSSLAVKIRGYERVPSSNETALLSAVANQPVFIQIDPSLFQFYKTGVLRGKCGTNLGHAVTIVGYGTNEVGIKFWLAKNSWGADWGEKGYIRLERNGAQVEGLCGLALFASYPIT